MSSSRRVDGRRLGLRPGGRASRATAGAVLALLLAAACGAPEEPGSSPVPTRLWTYDEVVAHTGDRIRSTAWPPGFTPTAQEIIGQKDAGPPDYYPGFDASRVAYDRMCAWWVAWRHTHRETGAQAAARLLPGLDAAVADFAASDNPGSPFDEQRKIVDRARGGEQTALEAPAFADLCYIGAGRWWDSRLPAPTGPGSG
jgi:hypothetical protein